MKKAEVKFENITKKFNETVAVDNVSCNFEAGNFNNFTWSIWMWKKLHL
jgi:ABC-type Fe3+/spermidine/putrescine transport system ATPase subunit